MVLATNGGVWIDGHPVEDWTVNNTSNSNNGENNYQEIESGVEDMAMAPSLSNFKPMLDSDWYGNQDFQTLQNHPEVRELGFCSNPAENTILHHSIDSSASCSPSQPFALDPSQSNHLFPQKSSFPSLLNVSGINPFDNAFDFPSETSFLGHFQPNQASNLVGFTQNQMGNPEFNLVPHFQPNQPDGNSCLGSGFNVGGIEGFDGSNTSDMFTNRAKLLKPLEVFPSIGSPPTLFQKRAAMRQSSGDKLENLEISGLQEKRDMEDGEAEGASIEISGFNYDSEELNLESKLEESTKNGGSCSNANSTVTGGDRKGKKKGMPAKNLMAERRRRKKLNDRLFMLRTAVPKISKMDRASILGDAIDYLKELLQKINDLHNELESNPPVPLVAPSTSFHPLTPTPSTLSCLVKEELCPSSFPSPKNQPAKVEVRVRDGGAVNIHMFCARRPGLLLSTMRALDSLGIDIQQAVISCFNGFALDVFRAEQCREGQGQFVLPEQIKAVLLDSAGFHGMV